MSKDRQALMYELVDALRLLGKVKWFLGDTSLSLDDFLVLDLISESEICNMKDIVESFSLPASTATGIVDRLVDKEYVKRDQSTRDRRMVTLQITRRGKQAYDRFRSGALTQMEESLSHLTESEIETLLDLVGKLITRMSS
ncbi:MAG: MarR family winged helix-turn-helix transcriptional regulator [Candidatus Thorarchaeota archaeon]|jgi:DNA-binding MarR family transcriptional regulator